MSEVSCQPTLIITVGLPRSGKTTWARAQGYPIVSPDAIRLALHGKQFIPDAEPMVWAIAKYMVRALHVAGHGIVILDACNSTKKRRDEWNSCHWAKAYHLLDTPVKTCLQRAEDASEELIWSIERMARNFEKPEGEWEWIS